jgi:hypothetical protein
MALGYAFGAIVVAKRDERRRMCLMLGLGATAAFVVLRATRLYGDPNPWNGTFLGFLNTTKYPASLQFLTMTLGPMIALVPLLEDARGWLVRTLAVFGRVPLFYYVLHIPLIHLAACLVSLVREGRVNPWLFVNFPSMAPRPPEGYMWSLPLLYAVTAAVVVTLYFPCRWYARLKAQRRDPWLQLL